jgi:hypothetical protein
MSAADFTRVAGQIRDLGKTLPKEAMTRATLTLLGVVMRRVPVGKTGNTRRSHTYHVAPDSSRGVVGTKSRIARYIHDGTGLYGPKKRKITPVTKKALRTPYGPRKSIKGMRPRPYMRDAAQEAKPAIDRELAAAGIRAIARVK